MTFVDEYLAGIRCRLDRIAGEQMGPISRAGELVARAIERKGLIHTFGTGHSHLLAEEIFARAGGLLSINAIESAPLMLHEDVIASGAWEKLTGVAGVMLEHAVVDPNSDVLFVISNSGRNAAPVEAAEWGSQHGVPVIALTSLAHSRSLPSLAPSGKKLYEVADVVLDNLGPPGDALVEVEPGLYAGASSTVIGACLLHCVVLAGIQACQERGVQPPVLISNNVAGAAQANARLVRAYSGQLTPAYDRMRRLEGDRVNARRLVRDG